MAHKVQFEIPRRELGSANVEFIVFRDGAVFGKLLISKGAVVWRPKWKSKRSMKFNWRAFDDVMQKHGRHIRGG